MNNKQELKALKEIRDNIAKLERKAAIKAVKERDNVENPYITIKGIKCYSEENINELYEGDLFNSSQCDKYIEKLNEKIEASGCKEDTLHEFVVRCYRDDLKSYNAAIHELEYQINPPEGLEDEDE